ncbi:hypothetical protein [Corynebacterium urogenitale]
MTDTDLSAYYKSIDEAASSIAEEVIEWRHHIHENPELSNREAKTEEFIVEQLKNIGIDDADITTGVGGHGVVAFIRSGSDDEGKSAPSSCVLTRMLFP